MALAEAEVQQLREQLASATDASMGRHTGDGSAGVPTSSTEAGASGGNDAGSEIKAMWGEIIELADVMRGMQADIDGLKAKAAQVLLDPLVAWHDDGRTDVGEPRDRPFVGQQRSLFAYNGTKKHAATEKLAAGHLGSLQVGKTEQAALVGMAVGHFGFAFGGAKEQAATGASAVVSTGLACGDTMEVVTTVDVEHRGE